MQLQDDPFEVKLGDNYELLRDENIEHGKRIAALESKIPELRAKHGFLSGISHQYYHIYNCYHHHTLALTQLRFNN